MYFSPIPSGSSRNIQSTPFRYWVHDPRQPTIDPDGDMQPIVLGGKNHRLRISSALAQMIARFGVDPDKRERQQHDCGVFALACMRNNSYEGQLFHAAGGYSITPVVGNKVTALSGLVPGSVILKSRSSSPRDLRRHHYAVVATQGSLPHETLFASKMGASGPVTIANYGQLHCAYPAISMWSVEGFSVELV